MDREEFKIEVPVVENDKVKLYVNGEYKGDVNELQVHLIAGKVVEHIKKTKDYSILDTFYFVGHEDSKNGKEIKATMNSFGYLNKDLWELGHTTRALLKLI